MISNRPCRDIRTFLAHLSQTKVRFEDLTPEPPRNGSFFVHPLAPFRGRETADAESPNISKSQVKLKRASTYDLFPAKATHTYAYIKKISTFHCATLPHQKFHLLKTRRYKLALVETRTYRDGYEPSEEPMNHKMGHSFRLGRIELKASINSALKSQPHSNYLTAAIRVAQASHPASHECRCRDGALGLRIHMYRLTHLAQDSSTLLCYSSTSISLRRCILKPPTPHEKNGCRGGALGLGIHVYRR